MKNDTFDQRQNASAAAKRAMLERFKGNLNATEIEAKLAERAAVNAAREQRQAERQAAREAEMKRLAEAAARLAAEEAARKAAEEAARKAEAERLAAEAAAEAARHAEELRRDAELTAAAEEVLKQHQKAKRDARYAARKARQR